MKKNIFRKWICMILATALFMLPGCGEDAGQRQKNASGDERETESVVATGARALTDGGENQEKELDAVMAITDFGVRLLQQSMAEPGSDLPPYASMPEDVHRKLAQEKNILLSPLSVLTALAMVGGGAGGETLEQMEESFGISLPELSAWLSAWQTTLAASEKCKLSMADSIWFTQDARFTLRQDFIDLNEKLFETEIYRTPFDVSTVEEINRWVEKNTDGMIGEILDEIPAGAVMYLVNALAFDAEWQEIYEERQVREREFTAEDGTVRKVDLMYSSESWYLEDENAQGFLKFYADEKYAFAALLPDEGVGISEYVASLTGERLHAILNNRVCVEVDAAIPKYENEYALELNEILQRMGMEDAFSDTKADFSGIGFSENGNLYISRVLHKTFIAVDEQGTKAGAATAVETDEGGMIETPDTKVVHLNRPFVYLIIDAETCLPVFMGIVMDAGI